MFDKAEYRKRRKAGLRGQTDEITIQGRLFPSLNRTKQRSAKRLNDPKHTKPYLLSRNEALYKIVKAAVRRRVAKREAIAKHYAEQRKLVRLLAKIIRDYINKDGREQLGFSESLEKVAKATKE